MATSYTRDQLHSTNAQRSFASDASVAAFLLGGIGTGNVSIGARGDLRDWEIFNTAAKGSNLAYAFFALWCGKPGEPPVAKILEAELVPPFDKSHGFFATHMAGIPRMRSSSMRGEYPYVWVDFVDDEVPVAVSLEAFTPFIPLNADDSSIPGAVFRYRVRNPTDAPIDVSIAGTVPNVVGFDGYSLNHRVKLVDEVHNEYRDDGNCRGVFFSSDKIPATSLKYGTMALTTAETEITAKPDWYHGRWWDGAHDFWDDFLEDGLLSEVQQPADGPDPANKLFLIRPGSLGIKKTVEPRTEVVYEFYLTWHFPNRRYSWNVDEPCCDGERECASVRNHYATRFDDAWSAASYLATDIDRLDMQSRAFHDALFGSTLPGYVIEAIANNITVLRSPTCFRIENGTFLGWEGCFDSAGCCAGSCTHVWNYAQTLAFLFPDLEWTMREVEFGLETDETGKMEMRTFRVFADGEPDQRLQRTRPAATDGQLGSIVRVFRDWKLTGNTESVQALWPAVKRAMDFAFEHWDADGDLVLDGQQHNTYDIAFVGPNSLSGSVFYAALKSCTELARELGDSEAEDRYGRAFSEGSERMDAMLWNGEYYVQELEDVNIQPYQYGQGCLSDQLVGQFLAHVAGLGHILPEEHARKAIKSVFDHNFTRGFRNHHSVQRTYALNDEDGLLLCSWPHGGRPRFPFVYSDEVWPGIEYQVAATLIYEGHVDEGLTLVRAVRDRHDGYRRNPWDEVECGHHYARSMASFALLPALSGMQCNVAAGELSFAPRINQEQFRSFWICGTGWGTYEQHRDGDTGEIASSISLLYGAMPGEGGTGMA